MKYLARALPRIGDKIKLDHGPDSHGTWKCWGTVRAIVDRDQIVVRVWWPRRQQQHYQLIDVYAWTIWPFLHRRGRRDLGFCGKRCGYVGTQAFRCAKCRHDRCYCQGASDDLPDLCDDCALKARKGKP